MTLQKTATALLFAFGLTAPANAAVIDFRTGDWGPGGSSSESHGGITVSAGPCLLGWCPELSWNSQDGFGVNSSNRFFDDRDDDEINNFERLNVAFSGGSLLTGFLVTDLYYEGGLSELGFYRLNGGEWTQFSAPTTNLQGLTNGELWVSFGPVAVTSLTFGYRNPLSYDTRNDFSLGGVSTSTTAIPEPATALLLGMGLIAGCFRTRKSNA